LLYRPVFSAERGAPDNASLAATQGRSPPQSATIDS